jgi:carbamate kinase
MMAMDRRGCTTVVPDETADLLMALLFAIRQIVESGARDKQRITSAYNDARSLIATIECDRGSARPRIEACLKHFNIYKNAGDVAAAGWMLAAIEERVGERNLYGWRRLGEIVDAAVHELLLFEQAALH